jgi:DNA replication and repair protein RecF
MDVPLGHPFVLLQGENGQGKTSILEAIYYLSRCRSFRTYQTKEVTSWGQKDFGLKAFFSEEPFQSLKAEWSINDKKFFIDDVEAEKLSDFWGKFTAVIFKNEDVELIRGSSMERRAWMDGFISSVQPGYLKNVQRLSAIVKQKNALLKDENPSREVWDALTSQLWETSQYISYQRKQFTEWVQPIVEEEYAALCQEKEKFEMIYKDTFSQHEKDDLHSLFQRETRMQSVLVGSHRDDWELFLKGKPLKNFGSEGQQKSVVLAMKLAEVKFIEEKTGKPPVILMDDMLNELDPQRQTVFWRLLPESSQWLYATTEALNESTLKKVPFTLLITPSQNQQVS